MTDFGAIDALLAGAKKEVPLPPAEERRTLRAELNLSRAQLAQALGVSPSTVGGWESGRDPSGAVREKYAYFLEGARTKLAAEAAEETSPEDSGSSEGDAPVPADAGQAEESGDDDVDVLAAPQPCVLCGEPARHQVAGFPQHLDPAECGSAESVKAAETAEKTEPAQPQPQSEPGVRVVPVGRRLQAADTPDLIGTAVASALAEHSGDVDLHRRHRVNTGAGAMCWPLRPPCPVHSCDLRAVRRRGCSTSWWPCRPVCGWRSRPGRCPGSARRGRPCRLRSGRPGRPRTGRGRRSRPCRRCPSP